MTEASLGDGSVFSLESHDQRGLKGYMEILLTRAETEPASGSVREGEPPPLAGIASKVFSTFLASAVREGGDLALFAHLHGAAFSRRDRAQGALLADVRPLQVDRFHGHTPRGLF